MTKLVSCIILAPACWILSDRTGAVQLATVNGEGGVGLTNLLHAPELPKGDRLKSVIRKILLT